MAWQDVATSWGAYTTTRATKKMARQEKLKVRLKRNMICAGAPRKIDDVLTLEGAEALYCLNHGWAELVEGEDPRAKGPMTTQNTGTVGRAK